MSRMCGKPHLHWSLVIGAWSFIGHWTLDIGHFVAGGKVAMTFTLPPQLVAELDEILTHYPQKRSASLMFLHALQEHFGYLSKEAIEWTAARLGLQPINVYELVTFYPMFREKPAGKYQLKVCRTLSCALGGSYK